MWWEGGGKEGLKKRCAKRLFKCSCRGPKLRERVPRLSCILKIRRKLVTKTILNFDVPNFFCLRCNSSSDNSIWKSFVETYYWIILLYFVLETIEKFHIPIKRINKFKILSHETEILVCLFLSGTNFEWEILIYLLSTLDENREQTDM